MNNRVLFVIACVLFAVDLVLVLVSAGDPKLREAFLLGGLTALAGGHAL